MIYHYVISPCKRVGEIGRPFEQPIVTQHSHTLIGTKEACSADIDVHPLHLQDFRHPFFHTSGRILLIA